MTQGELQIIINDAKQIIYDYRYNIQKTLDCVNKLKGVDIENAEIKEDIDEMVRDIERQLKLLSDDMNVSF